MGRTLRMKMQRSGIRPGTARAPPSRRPPSHRTPSADRSCLPHYDHVSAHAEVGAPPPTATYPRAPSWGSTADRSRIPNESREAISESGRPPAEDGRRDAALLSLDTPEVF